MTRRFSFLLVGLLFSLFALEIILRAGGFVLSLSQKSEPFSKGAYTILTLGESTTFQGGEDSWPKQLERILNTTAAKRSLGLWPSTATYKQSLTAYKHSLTAYRRKPQASALGEDVIEKSLGMQFSVINKGLPTTNSTIILSQLEENLEKYKPNMVIAMMGINDSDVLQEGFVPSDIKPSDSPLLRFFKNLRLYKLIRLLFQDRSGSAALAKSRIKPKENPQGFGAWVKTVFAQNTGQQEILNRVTSYRRQGRIEEAEKTLREAIKTSPRETWAYLELSRLLGDIGRQSEAVELLKEAISTIGENDELYVALGNSYRLQGKQEEQEKAYLRAIELNPRNSIALGELGKIQYDFGRFEEAEEFLTKALKIEPNNYDALLKLGALRIQFGDYEEAEELFEKASEIEQNSYIAYMQLAHVYRLLEKESEAKAVEEEAQSRFTLVQNYRRLRDILKERGIKLVAMQYPMRSVEPLKEMLDYDKDVIFVSNEENFKQALQEASYEELFTDRFAGDFGHTTAKGSELIAQNVARVIEGEIFGK